ncbi:MAG: hypothetical protein EPO23_14540 [Xanthobacteraceae bacterium]|nr:MAG: hypothetical protein EPO23_14540 [Xanthobacteraceae bacterium]
MADDKADPTEPAHDDAGAHARRAPPTIDLAASEFSGEPKRPARFAHLIAAARAGWKTVAVAVVAAALTAAMVAGLVLYLGAPEAPPAATVPDPALAMLSDLSARLKRIESLPAPAAAPEKAAATDAELVARLNVAEQALHAVREQIAALRRQADAVASAVNELKSAPREAAAPTEAPAAPAPDTAALGERLAEIDRALGALQGRIGERPPAMAGERELRRVVAAILLDTAARGGAPYAAELDVARRLAVRPGALAPLETFATTGIPNDAALSAMIAPLVPQLAGGAAEPAPRSGTLWERLQTQAAKLVRIRPAGEQPGTDVAAIASRVEAAVRRNDTASALRELAVLPPERRAVAEPVIARAAARASALEAARQFLANAMTAFADTSLVKTAP